jgi:hypothetical protein
VSLYRFRCFIVRDYYCYSRLFDCLIQFAPHTKVIGVVQSEFTTYTNFGATDFKDVKFNFEEYVAKIRHMGLYQDSRLSMACQL